MNRSEIGHIDTTDYTHIKVQDEFTIISDEEHVMNTPKMNLEFKKETYPNN